MRIGVKPRRRRGGKTKRREARRQARTAVLTLPEGNASDGAGVWMRRAPGTEGRATSPGRNTTMMLRSGTTWTNCTVRCEGCRRELDCSTPYITLELDNSDKSLAQQDFWIAHFHSQACIATALLTLARQHRAMA